MNDFIIIFYSIIVIVAFILSRNNIDKLFNNKLFILLNIVFVIGLACSNEEVLAVIIITFFIGLIILHSCLYTKHKPSESARMIHEQTAIEAPAEFIEKSIEQTKKQITKADAKIVDEFTSGFDFSTIGKNVSEDPELYDRVISEADRRREKEASELMSNAYDRMYVTDTLLMYLSNGFNDGIVPTPDNVLSYSIKNSS